eukprot:14134-Rhodomonas_salina.2
MFGHVSAKLWSRLSISGVAPDRELIHLQAPVLDNLLDRCSRCAAREDGFPDPLDHQRRFETEQRVPEA